MWFMRHVSILALVLAAREARAEIGARPTDPQGAQGYSYDAEPAAHFDTANVRVWYVTSGKHSVRPASSRVDGVPDDVARVGEVTESALQTYAAMGYRAPIADEDSSCGSNGGDGRLDVYLVHFAAADGTTVAECCKAVGSATQCASFILVEANFQGRYPTVDEGIRTVLPHEVFHTVQNAYDAELDRFWAEGTAQWAAKTLDPSLHDLERFLPSFFEEEGRSIDVPPGGVTAGYLYGAAIWPVFLTRRFDPAIVREILEEEAASGASALDAAREVLEHRRSSLDDAWPTFWTWNASTGARADATGYADAALYPLLPSHELADVVSGITSGSIAYVYHVAPTARVDVTLESNGTHRAYLLPLEGGKAVLAKATALPTATESEALVVLTSLTKSKADAPYTLRVTAATDEPTPSSSPSSAEPRAESSGGCSASRAVPRGGAEYAIAAALLLLVVRRGRLSKGGLLALAALLSSCDRTSSKVSSREDAQAKDRIVSVGSAVTETLFALGAGEDVVGVDTSSLFPAEATKLPQVGYQRTLAAEGILALRPTVVLASAEAGPPAVLEQLRSAGVRLEVIGAEPTDVGVNVRVRRIAEIVGRDPSKVIAELDADLTRAKVEREKATTHPKALVLYARGGSTLHVFGKNTTAETMVRLAGGENAVTTFDGTKPLTPEALAAAAPDVIVIPSRGLDSVGGVDALLKVPGVATTPAGKTKRIVPIDDLLLLGFGPRTGKAALELGAKLRGDAEAK